MSAGGRRIERMTDDELRDAYRAADAVCTEAEAKASAARERRRVLADEMARRERALLQGAA